MTICLPLWGHKKIVNISINDLNFLTASNEAKMNIWEVIAKFIFIKLPWITALEKHKSNNC